VVSKLFWTSVILLLSFRYSMLNHALPTLAYFRVAISRRTLFVCLYLLLKRCDRSDFFLMGSRVVSKMFRFAWALLLARARPQQHPDCTGLPIPIECLTRMSRM
jgi:hypothetical protein